MTKSEASQASPEMVEGPFYSNGGEYRANLREGQQGQKLDLTITVVNAENGEPYAGVDIDLWHCNATGHYSGYDVDPDALPENISNGQPATNDDTYLRGKLTTNAQGQVTFQTIYPAWYTLRTPHIHLKIFEGDNCNTTTQLYFPEDVSQELYSTPEYARNATQDTYNKTDPVFGNTPGDTDSLWIDIEKGPEFFLGSAVISIAPGNINDLIIVPSGRIPPLGGRPHDKPVR
jgi:protocatechuate 3,4-dioxygenase beta subunit